MINEDFLALVPGTMGEVTYRKKVENKIPQKAKEEFIDKFVNARLNAMVMKYQYGMDGGEEADPQAEFLKSREMARQELEKGQVGGTKTESLYLQINQKESYDAVIKAEQDPDFVGWNFPAFIEEFKRSYLEFIGEE